MRNQAVVGPTDQPRMVGETYHEKLRRKKNEIWTLVLMEDLKARPIDEMRTKWTYRKWFLFVFSVLVLLTVCIRLRGYYIPLVSNGTKAEFHIKMLEWYSSTDFFDQDNVDFHKKQLDSCDCDDVVDAALELYYDVGCNPRSTLRPLSLFRRCKSETATAKLKKLFETEEDNRLKMLTGIAYFCRTGDRSVLERIIEIPLDEFGSAPNSADLLCLDTFIQFYFPDAPPSVYFDSKHNAHFLEEFKEWVKNYSPGN